MVDEKTDTKALDVAPKPAPKKRAAASLSRDFGDPALTRPGVEPLGADKRDKKPLHHAIDNIALALSPPQLALLVTLMPLVATSREAVLGAFGGIALGAVIVAIVQGPLVRYGVSLTVAGRAAFGVRGAWLMSLLRVVLSAGFYAQACVLAVETLLWCVLCSMPQAAASFQRIPLFGSISALSAGLALLLGVGVWFLGREPRTIVRLILLAPALILPVALFLLPGNLPPQAAWGIVDLVGRSESTSLMPVITGATFWSASIWLMNVNDARRMPSQLGQVAASISGVLPWLLSSLAFALAVLSSGKGDTGLFDLPALACRRLPSAGLVAVLGASALGFLWPLVAVAKAGVKGGMQELATSVPVRRSGEWLALALMLILAIMSRASFVTVVFDVQLYLAALYVVMSLCVVAHYYAVERGRFVLDDLYSERGAYRGIAGVAPAGLLSVLAGAAAFLFLRGVFEATALRAMMAVLVAMLAQVIFGNVQRLLVR